MEAWSAPLSNPQRARPLRLSPSRAAALLAAGLILAAANFMAVLDTTIANVSVPSHRWRAGCIAVGGTWTITSYSVAEAITVPLTRLALCALRHGQDIRQRHHFVRVFPPPCAALRPSLGILVLFRCAKG